MRKHKFAYPLAIILAATLSLGLAAPVSAQVCAVCVVAITSGLGISRWLGIDDAITGVWLGALVLALASTLSRLASKKKPDLKWLPAAIFVGVYAVFVSISLYFNWFALSGEKLWGMSRLLVGVLLGTGALLLGLLMDKWLRRLKNDCNRPYFPFQKVVVPVLVIILASVGLWLAI